MQDELPFVPDAETEVAASDAQPNPVSTGQTKPAVDPRDSEIAVMKQEIESLKRSQQSLQDKTIAAVKKQIQQQHRAIDTLATSEGWDAEAIRTRKEREAQKILLQLGSADLNALDDTENKPPAVNETITVDRQVELLRAHLEDLGLSEQDLGGLEQFKGMTRGSPEAKRFELLKAKALQGKEQAATQAAQNLQRDADAVKTKETLEQYGNLGGTGSGGEARLSSPILNIDDSRELYERARQQMMAKSQRKVK